MRDSTCARLDLSTPHSLAEDRAGIDDGAQIAQPEWALLALERQLRGWPLTERVKRHCQVNW
jgi:hypothetical protein